MSIQQIVPQGMSGQDYSFGQSPPAQPKPIEKLGYKERLAMIAWAKAQFQSIKQDRAKVERQWYLNMCFYRGKQNVAVRNNTNMMIGAQGALYTPPAPYYRSRPVINRVRGIVRSEMSKLTAQKPTAYVLPATSSDEDLFAAQAGEQIWESKYRAKKVPAVFRRALWWNQVCGNGFVRCYWDEDAVDEVSDQMGDIEYKAVTPFHLFIPDLSEEDLEEQPFLIYAQLHTSDWVKMHYPEAQVSSKSDQTPEVLDNAWLDIIGAQNAENRKNVLALEVWIKPGRVQQMPEGGVFVVVGESIVEYHPGWPYAHKKYPFAKLSHIPTGKFYTESTLVDAIPLQREYNRTRGQIIEAKNRTSKPQLMAEAGAVDPAKITSEPGLVIEYKLGYGKPEPLPLQSIPNYVVQELDRIVQDLSDISGQHEVSKGQVPPGVTAATAINYLQEQDDSMLSYTFASLEEAYEKVAAMTLSYAQQFWDTPRTVKITGNDGFFDAQMFLGSDLRNNTDIRVEAGSALPISKSAKQAFIMDLMKMGFVDPVTGLEVMEMGGIAKIYEQVQIDVRQAQRENLRLAKIDDNMFMQAQEQGLEAQIIPVNTWDNHNIHIATHDRYRKGQAYENLSDGAKQAFEIHVQMHKLAMAQGMTGQNIMEMMKPENMDSAAAAEEGGGNQFTAADQMQQIEMQGQPASTGSESSGQASPGGFASE